MSETTTKPCYGENEAGCWFDGHRGIYLGDAVIQEAVAHGWTCDVEGQDAGPYQTSPTWSDCEEYHDLWDEAEEYMQQFADDRHYFGGNGCGDWGLWPITEDEE